MIDLDDYESFARKRLLICLDIFDPTRAYERESNWRLLQMIEELREMRQICKTQEDQLNTRKKRKA